MKLSQKKLTAILNFEYYLNHSRLFERKILSSTVKTDKNDDNYYYRKVNLLGTDKILFKTMDIRLVKQGQPPDIKMPHLIKAQTFVQTQEKLKPMTIADIDNYIADCERLYQQTKDNYIWKSKDENLKTVTEDGYKLRNMFDCWEDVDMILAAIPTYPNIFYDINEKLQKNKSIVLKAIQHLDIKSTGSYFLYRVGEEFSDDLEIMEQLILKRPEHIKKASKRLQENEVLVLKALVAGSHIHQKELKRQPLYISDLSEPIQYIIKNRAIKMELNYKTLDAQELEKVAQSLLSELEFLKERNTLEEQAELTNKIVKKLKVL